MVDKATTITSIDSKFVSIYYIAPRLRLV